MALQKTIASDYGFDASYWRLHSMQIYYDDSGVFADITLVGFRDEAARLGGKKSFLTSQNRITGLAADPTRAEIYAEVKKLPEFSGAADV